MGTRDINEKSVSLSPEAHTEPLGSSGSFALSRRRFIAGAGAGLIGLGAGSAQAKSALMCPPVVGQFAGGNGSSGVGVDNTTYDYSDAVPEDGPSTRKLNMTMALGDRFNRTYVENGQYVQSALEEFKHFARSKYDNSEHAMDPRVMDIIWKVSYTLGYSGVITLTSGYRSPAHNASLRGAAKNSFHMKGMACDIVIPGYSVAQMYSAARAVNMGGVGKYTSSGFVHVDSGPVRTWGS